MNRSRLRARAGRILIGLAIGLSATVSIGGGGSVIALGLTTQPEFCKTCHLMEPYYDSWKHSSHSKVTCVDCHFEPGLLETIEGKFQAVAMLAKYITNTEGTKPWAHVSDYSCMRAGCHSQQLLEGEINFGRIRFNHRHHLVGFRIGTRLKCTSCHSQIVQGNHLSVTVTSCFLCHFAERKTSTAADRPISDCNTCHGPPQETIPLGEFDFRHRDYLARGVNCDSCHGDVTRGAGDVPRTRCVSCHNVQEHLDRYPESEFLHAKHVGGHGVSCIECHTEIEHGLPSREEHFQGDCRECHKATHGASSQMYRGTGVEGVEESPSIMYLARVTCTGCHRPPFPGAAVPTGGATFAADPIACIDCHGPGYDGMQDRWQEEFRATAPVLQKALKEVHALLGTNRRARKHYDEAARALALALIDRSDGVHNLGYARDLFARADEELREARRAIDPDDKTAPIPIGPFAPSKENCTQLCHVGVEKVEVRTSFGFRFTHGPHLEKNDCSDCHQAAPHGTTTARPADCAKCHHTDEEGETCAGCHPAQAQLRAREVPGVDYRSMQDLDCVTCHLDLHAADPAKGLHQSCDECHEDDAENFAAEYLKPWIEESEEPLRAVLERLATASPEIAAAARAEIEALLAAGAYHNKEHAEHTAKKWAAQLK
ncbi:MAG: multiheme c-type cytochrome [Planctomycetota bacterium]